jgi:hypothetical protein
MDIVITVCLVIGFFAVKEWRATHADKAYWTQQARERETRGTISRAAGLPYEAPPSRPQKMTLHELAESTQHEREEQR